MVRDLTAAEVAGVYGRRLEVLRRLRVDHGRELNAAGIRLLNRCTAETLAVLGVARALP